MSWIRSDKAILHHPKTLLLADTLGVEIEVAIGRLHMLWWWCLDYALDGDLSKHSPKVIESSCKIPLKVLKTVGFVDKSPYLRIHDWWDNQGNYLKLRFKDHPEKWHQIKEFYEKKSLPSVRRSVRQSPPKCNPVDVDLHTDVRTLQTDVRTYGETEPRETSALGASPRALSAPKSFEEAGDNELCGPPKNMGERIKK